MGFVIQKILPAIEASGGSSYRVQLCYEVLKEQPYQWLWSDSIGEMRMFPGRGASPRSMPTQNQDAQDGGCSKETSEFVNHGLLLWNESRQKWAGKKKATARSNFLLVLKSRKLWVCCMDPSKGKHNLLKSNKPFDKPVPLGEMVDTLVVVWEEEGMYKMV